MNQELRFGLTINQIECADNFEEHSELYNQAIQLLTNRIKAGNFEEFSDEERELLEETFTTMEMI